jgi:hypothetical protein
MDSDANFDYGKFFDSLRQRDVSGRAGVSGGGGEGGAGSSVSFSGVVLRLTVKASSVSYRLLLEEPLPAVAQSWFPNAPDAFIYVRPQEHANQSVSVLDFVRLDGCKASTGSKNGSLFVNAASVVRLPVPPTLPLAMQLVPLPIADQSRGRPFLLHSGLLSEGAGHEGAPGFFRTTRWWSEPASCTYTKQASNTEERRLDVSFTHSQWMSPHELRTKQFTELEFRMLVWDNHCRQLPGDGLTSNDLNAWSAIMAANPIPFTAACYVDTTYNGGGGRVHSLSLIGLRWDLRTYLERSNRCVALSASDVEELVPGLAPFREEMDDGTIINVSVAGVLPQGPRWRFFALTDNPTVVRSAADLSARSASTHAVYLALCSSATTTTRQTLVDVDDNENDVLVLEDSPLPQTRKSQTPGAASLKRFSGASKLKKAKK